MQNFPRRPNTIRTALGSEKEIKRRSGLGKKCEENRPTKPANPVSSFKGNGRCEKQGIVQDFPNESPCLFPVVSLLSDDFHRQFIAIQTISRKGLQR